MDFIKFILTHRSISPGTTVVKVTLLLHLCTKWTQKLRVLIKHCYLMGKNTVQAQQWLEKSYRHRLRITLVSFKKTIIKGVPRQVYTCEWALTLIYQQLQVHILTDYDSLVFYNTNNGVIHISRTVNCRKNIL